jgi:hypothetical protein
LIVDNGGVVQALATILNRRFAQHLRRVVVATSADVDVGKLSIAAKMRARLILSCKGAMRGSVREEVCEAVGKRRGKLPRTELHGVVMRTSIIVAQRVERRLSRVKVLCASLRGDRRSEHRGCALVSGWPRNSATGAVLTRHILRC